MEDTVIDNYPKHYFLAVVTGAGEGEAQLSAWSQALTYLPGESGGVSGSWTLTRDHLPRAQAADLGTEAQKGGWGPAADSRARGARLVQG